MMLLSFLFLLSILEATTPFIQHEGRTLVQSPSFRKSIVWCNDNNIGSNSILLQTHHCHLFISSQSSIIFSKQSSNHPLFLSRKQEEPTLREKEDEEGSNSESIKNEEAAPATTRSFSRRETLLLAGGCVAYGTLAGSAISRLSQQFLNGDGAEIRPAEHENRVKHTIAEAANFIIPEGSRPLRILEVGMGPACQSVLRGYYQEAIDQVYISRNSIGVPLGSQGNAQFAGVDLTGIDLELPSSQQINRARERLSGQINKGASVALTNEDGTECPRSEILDGDVPGSWSFQTVQGSADSMPFRDNSFDMVTTIFALCSVANQVRVVEEIKRVLRPGGTFGYLEHVAVLPEDNRPFFEWQQTTLDPLQQIVAHNCHLHRDTQQVISNVFVQRQSLGYDSTLTSSATAMDSCLLKQERFFVKDMWPVCSQLAGIVRKV